MKIIAISLLLLMSTTIYSKGFDFKIKVYGHGQPMLLIPGLSSDARVWDETVERYKNKYQLHVLTLPGFAGLPAMDLKNGFLPPICAEILAYIEQEKLKNPVVMGHSLGGFLALLMASKNPQLFSKIIIVDSVPFFAGLRNPKATQKDAIQMAEMMKKQMQESRKEMLSSQLDITLSTMIKNKDKMALAKKWGMASDGETVRQAMYELMTTDLRDDIAVIQSPVLLLGAWVAYKNYGATHESVATTYGAQYSKVKNFKLYLTDIGYHFIMWDDPKFFFDKVDHFLQQ